MESPEYVTQPLDEAFSREVALAYPLFLKRARRSTSRVFTPEDIVQEALGEAWKYASVNGLPNTRNEFVRWGICIVGWKAKDSHKYAKNFEREFLSSDAPENFSHVVNGLQKSRPDLAADIIIYRELCERFSERVIALHRSPDSRASARASMIPYFIDGVNMHRIAAEKGCSPNSVIRTKANLVKLALEVADT